MPHPPRKAFTIRETRVVLLLLAVLIAVIIPQLTRATGVANDTAIAATLKYIRGQIEVFHAQHYALPQNGTLWTLLQSSSDANETATTTPTGTHFGPYFRSSPLNVWNNKTAASNLPVDKDAGWYYKATSVDFDLRIRNPDGSVNYNY